MAYKVYLDAGHGGYDNGASYNGRKEKDDNLKLAMEVGRRLRDQGIDVEYTRSTDTYQSPNEKAQIANDNGADLFVSLHRNSSPVPNTYQGVETLIYDTNDDKDKFANNINGELSKLGFQNLGVDVRKNLAVLKRTKMPALLVNVGFVNTDEDNKMFDQEFNQVAQAIVNGIMDTLKEDNVQVPSVKYRIQVGLFKSQKNAEDLQDRLLERGYSADVQEVGGLYAVLIGQYQTIEDAEKEEESLNNAGYETIVIEL